MIILRKLDTTDYVSEAEFTVYSGTLQQQITGHLTAYNPHNINLPGLGAQDYLDFNLTVSGVEHSEGRVYWNDDDKTLNVDMSESEVVLQVGQEQFLRATNKTGDTILNGSVVYIDGAQGSRPTIDLVSSADTAAVSKTIGVATHDIEDNTTGYITTFGLVRGLNTDAFSEGETLWLGIPPGSITNIEPVSPNHTVRVAHCIRKSTTEGIILVSIINGFDICDLHDVACNTPLDGQVLVWSTVSGVYAPRYLDDRYYTEVEVDFKLTTLSGVLQSQIDDRVTIDEFTTYSGIVQEKLAQLELDMVAYAIILG